MQSTIIVIRGTKSDNKFFTNNNSPEHGVRAFKHSRKLFDKNELLESFKMSMIFNVTRERVLSTPYNQRFETERMLLWLLRALVRCLLQHACFIIIFLKVEIIRKVILMKIKPCINISKYQTMLKLFLEMMRTPYPNFIFLLN